jgi:tRNA uridine 5-carboxymethylaminomethyl modification enzyme
MNGMISATSTFDVIVIGAGHAGCEAALAAARMGCATALVTLDTSAVGRLSCNPAIGGVAKGHLVREIDALGGEMGRAIDATGIQFRLLNASRGPAVQAPRAQADKDAYPRRMSAAVAAAAHLRVLEGEASDLIIEGGAAHGIILADGRRFSAAAVIVTSGTFLRGLLHVGLESRPGGRIGESPAVGLSRALARCGLPLGRLKTGTPPRVLRDTVDLGRLVRQRGDPEPVPFSFETDRIEQSQVDCHITFTGPRTHDLIRANLDASPLYSGAITSVGPRYCPSIEDKVVRFADRDRHQLFVEPEGREHPWLYLNGLSMSLPEEIQWKVVHSIPGLEEAKIARAGYAVEYDFVHPTACSHSLETKSVRGLFLAGQINGTTGYEEAAALGLMAGINAALKIRGEPSFIPSRAEAYIGVLIDDLVLKGTNEPYRMFTSRAEYRLLLDIDSADLRLTDHGRRLGLIESERYARFLDRRERIRKFREALETTSITPRVEVVEKARSIMGIHIKVPTSPAMLLRRNDVRMEDLERFMGDALPNRLGRRERASVENRLRYGGYIERQERDVARMRREEARRIPVRFDYASVPGLSNEIIEKLTTARPENLAQAARISGVTPAAVTLINILLEKRRRAIPDAAPRFRRRGAPIGAPRNTGSGSLSWRRNHS